MPLPTLMSSRHQRAAGAAALATGLVAATLTGIGTAPPADAADRCRTKIVIGKSVKGRAIVACQLGNPALKPMLFIGQMHGNETAGLSTATTLMRSSVPSTINLWVIRTMNPDGNASKTRKNARGVDLNRNFPLGWKKRTGNYASGSRAASEPETRAVVAFVKKYKPYTSVIAHQPFNLVDISANGDVRVSKRLATLSSTKLVRLSTSKVPGAKTYTGTLTSWLNAAVPMSTSITYEFGSRPSAARKAKLAKAVITLAKERVTHTYRSRLDMKISATPVAGGARVGMTAYFSVERRDAKFVRSPQRQIYIWARVGGGAWKPVAGTKTNGDGAAWAGFRPTQSTCYQARYASAGFWGATNSKVLCVGVKPKPTPPPATPKPTPPPATPQPTAPPVTPPPTTPAPDPIEG